MAARVRDVIWAESARDALDAVIAYIAQDSQQAAAQVLDEALRAGANLVTPAAISLLLVHLKRRSA